MKKCEIFNDSFQNYKVYHIPKAQLVIADIPYNLGVNAYASNPMWYKDGNNTNGESKLAGKGFFNSDFNFKITEFFHFCSKMIVPEPKQGSNKKPPCMIVFCAFEQINEVIETAKQYGFLHNIPLFFIKNYSAQVLKANMKIVGATEHAVLLYRDKLPKFNNNGKMIFNWQVWEKDGKEIPKIHPTQKPVKVLKPLIKLFTDENDVIIDPVCGSGTTLRAAAELGRECYGFEIVKDFFKKAKQEMLVDVIEDEKEIVYQNLTFF